MAIFNKYPKIQNSYNLDLEDEELIYDITELETADFIIQDKIDGSNLSLIFTPCSEMRVASRNQITTMDFMGLKNVLSRPEWQHFISQCKKYANNFGVQFTVFGELFGEGVLHRIKYGKADFRVFDMMILKPISEEIIWFTPEVTQMLCKEFQDAENPYPYYVPVFDVVYGIDTALSYNVNQIDPILSLPGNYIEGVIIRPYDINILSKYGDRFILKKKRAEFAEGKIKAEKFKTKQEDQALVKLAQDFSEYINENRVLSYFSKNGFISNLSELGNYIKGVHNDAYEDFIQDNNLKLSKTDRKYILSKNTDKLVKILRGHLEKIHRNW